MKKLSLYILILIVLAGLFSPVVKVSAQVQPGKCWVNGAQKDNWTLTSCQQNNGTWSPTNAPDGTCTFPDGHKETGYKQVNCAMSKGTWAGPYVLLAPLPCQPSDTNCDKNGQVTTFDPASTPGTQNNKIGEYLNLMIKIFIGLCAVLAVIMIVIGGIEYMTSELISSKEAGRERITQAILGLLLALGAWTILNQINPDILRTDLNSLANVSVDLALAQEIATYTGQGTCTPVADSSNPCSATNLANAGFTNATQASSICNGESRGDATRASGVDKGSDGNAFSFGLFQVNILAHANEIKDSSGNLVCNGIFTIDPNPPGKVGTSSNDNTLGGCLQKDPSGRICIKYAATVTNPTKYQSCKNYITNTNNNITYAAGLQTSRNWNQWGANASCHF